MRLQVTSEDELIRVINLDNGHYGGLENWVVLGANVRLSQVESVSAGTVP
jgi:hypothetical protein